MTGEITLRGRVLPIGGLKEKILAAKTAGIRTVLVPKKNEKDIEEISGEIKAGLSIHFMETMEDVLAYALTEFPPAEKRSAGKSGKSSQEKEEKADSGEEQESPPEKAGKAESKGKGSKRKKQKEREEYDKQEW